MEPLAVKLPRVRLLPLITLIEDLNRPTTAKSEASKNTENHRVKVKVLCLAKLEEGAGTKRTKWHEL